MVRRTNRPTVYNIFPIDAAVCIAYIACQFPRSDFCFVGGQRKNSLMLKQLEVSMKYSDINGPFMLYFDAGHIAFGVLFAQPGPDNRELIQACSLTQAKKIYGNNKS